LVKNAFLEDLTCARLAKTIKRTVAGEAIATFIPYPLPSRDPPLSLGGKLAAILARAEHALARLEVAGEMVPLNRYLRNPEVRERTVTRSVATSSAIEGIRAPFGGSAKTGASSKIRLKRKRP
jgi:hypothetical protein